MSNNKLGDFISRVRNLEEQRQALAEDVREVLKEAKEAGFNPKIIRKVIARQKFTEHELREEARLIAEYESAIGDLNGTPLGEAGRP